jgi:hypothetical protein
MIEITWTPGETFSWTGNSGSMYFARRGCLFVPFAIHRGNPYFQVRSGTKLPQCSYATPLSSAVAKLCMADDSISDEDYSEAHICQKRTCP